MWGVLPFLGGWYLINQCNEATKLSQNKKTRKNMKNDILVFSRFWILKIHSAHLGNLKCCWLLTKTVSVVTDTVWLCTTPFIMYRTTHQTLKDPIVCRWFGDTQADTWVSRCFCTWLGWGAYRLSVKILPCSSVSNGGQCKYLLLSNNPLRCQTGCNEIYGKQLPCKTGIAEISLREQII